MLSEALVSDAIGHADPTLPDGLGSRPVDAEGIPAKRTILVENGILRSWQTITTVGLEVEWDFGMRIACGTPMVEVLELSFAGA